MWKEATSTTKWTYQASPDRTPEQLVDSRATSLRAWDLRSWAEIILYFQGALPMLVREVRVLPGPLSQLKAGIFPCTRPLSPVCNYSCLLALVRRGSGLQLCVCQGSWEPRGLWHL